MISSVVIVIFFLVYTASALAAGGKLFHLVFGLDYRIALTIGAAVILLYTFMGGFMAVCVTDFIQGMLMLVGILAVPIVALVLVGSGNITSLLDASGVAGGLRILSESDAQRRQGIYGNGDFLSVCLVLRILWNAPYPCTLYGSAG